MILARRWRGDTDVEFDQALLVRVVSHGVCTNDRLVDLGYILPLVELVPVAPVLGLDVEVLVVHLVGWALQLHVTTGAEVHTRPQADAGSAP